MEDDNEDNDRHLVNDIKKSNQDQHSNEEDDGELQNLSDVKNLREPEEDYVAVPSEVKPEQAPEEGSHKDAPISKKKTITTISSIRYDIRRGNKQLPMPILLNQTPLSIHECSARIMQVQLQEWRPQKKTTPQKHLRQRPNSRRKWTSIMAQEDGLALERNARRARRRKGPN